MKKSDRERQFLEAWHEYAGEFPDPEREHRFHPERKWRFDFAFPSLKVAVEIEGGTFGRWSRHTTGAGHQGDCEKRNAATVMGWKVLYFTTKDLQERPDRCVEMVLEAMGVFAK